MRPTLMRSCTIRYRVKVEIQDEPAVGPPVCVFRHPVQPGPIPGGWMVRPQDEAAPPRVPMMGAEMAKRMARHIPMSEVAKV